MKTLRLTLTSIVLALSALNPQPGYAFGGFGHRTIATATERALSPAARAEVEKLLKVAPRPTLEALSTWPDEIIYAPDALEADKKTMRWHYMNFPKGDCALSIKKACPDGLCLVPQLNAQIALLSDHDATRAQRARALGFVLHLYADLHQPLHLGFAVDRGGNDFQISLKPQDATASIEQQRAGSNLHTLWDSLIFDQPQLGIDAEAAAIFAIKAKSTKQRRAARLTDVIEIARESCALVQAKDFYPPNHKITRAYLEKMRPVAQARVALAAQRLALLLNRILPAR